jgi:hypothetical protein
MAFRFSIGRKIGTGFGVLIFLTLLAFILTVATVSKSKEQTDAVVGQVTPAVSALKEYNFLLQKSQTLMAKWYYIQSKNDEPFKNDLRNLIDKEYPNIKTLMIGQILKKKSTKTLRSFLMACSQFIKQILCRFYLLGNRTKMLISTFLPNYRTRIPKKKLRYCMGNLMN